MEKRVVFRSSWLPYLLVAPQIAITVIFFFWPAFQAVFYSFFLQDAFGTQSQFVGLANFVELFRSDAYLASIQVTAVFSTLATVLGLALALVLAVAADGVVRGALAYKTLLIWPYAVASAVAGVLFAFLFAPSVGIISYLLRGMGVDWNWVLRGEQAMLLVVVATVWKQISYNFLFFLAGLQAIPRPLLEAAALDGSGPLRRARDIQLPLLAPTFFFLLVINVTETFVDSFGIVDITTGGGPARATDLMVYKIYSDGFKGLDYSMAAAQSIVLMALVIGLTFVQFRYVERKVQY